MYKEEELKKLSNDFKLITNVNADKYPIGSFERKYIDHFCNGNKLQNMDRFIETRKHFEKYGVYTLATRNSHPNSQWMKFWNEERRRSIDGYHVEGDWIPGYLYFYWNFSPIILVEALNGEEGKEGRVRGERVLGFPHLYDSDYFWFHYVEEAEKRGLHCSNIKKRGAGYSFKGASMLCRNYALIKNSKSYVFADQKEYLTKDGIITKAWDLMNWLDTHTAWGKRRLVDTELHKVSGFQKTLKTGVKVQAGFKSEIIAVSLAGDSSKAHPYSQEVITPSGKMLWKDVKEGTILFGGDGNTTNVKEIHEFGIRDVYKLSFNDGKEVMASENHEWEIYEWCSNKEVKRKYETKDLLRLLEINKNRKFRIRNLKNPIEFKEQSIPIDSYTLGLMLGDGSISKSTNNQSPITMLHDDFNSISKYIPYKTRNENWGGNIRNVIFIPNGRDIFKQLELFDKRAGDKFIPEIYKYNSSKVRFDVINGLLDTDGSVTNDFGVIEYSTKSKQLAEDFIWIIRTLGLNGKISTKKINGNIYYRCYIYCNKDEKRLFNLERKKERIKLKKQNKWALNKVDYITLEKIEYSHKEEVKCVTVDSFDTTYLIGNQIITLNSRGKRGKLVLWEEGGSNDVLREAWIVARSSMEKDNITFGTMIVWGTGGDKESNFIGLEEIMRKPDGYNIYGIPNIFDGKIEEKVGFFVPDYLNTEGNFDKDGNTDIVKAVIEIDKVRKKAKHNTSSNIYIRTLAEHPYTIDEATLRMDASPFDIATAREVLSILKTSGTKSEEPGEFIINAEGRIEWRCDFNKQPIEAYPISSNDLNKQGCWVIYNKPVVKDGNIQGWRYLGGLDPIDFGSDESSSDKSNNHSLASTFIIDSITETIVAEYTGRPNISEDYYEQLWRGIEYYNATLLYENNLKGVFSYFRNKNKLHLLADEPKSLKDKWGYKENNRVKGFHSTDAINKFARGLINTWSLSDHIVGQNDVTGELQIVPKFYTIKSIPLLQEIIAWNSKGNFDRISSLGATLILLDDRRLHIDSVKNNIKSRFDDSKFFSSINRFISNKTRLNRLR